MQKRELTPGGVKKIKNPIEIPDLVQSELAEKQPRQKKMANTGGAWSHSSNQFASAQIEILKKTKQSIIENLLSGRVAVEINISDIDTSVVDTDRLSGWDSEDSIKDLRKSIRQRGQLQPIKVRPDENWEPNFENPLEISQGSFVLLSGRRRLEALKQIEQERVWCTLYTPAANLSKTKFNQKIEDLRERFDENTKRKNLTAFEKLVSIGEIAEAMLLSEDNMTQSEIAKALGCQKSDVSIGSFIFSNRSLVEQHIDERTTNEHAIRSLIPKLRKMGEGEDTDIEIPKIQKRLPEIKPAIDTKIKSRTNFKLNLNTGSSIYVKAKGHIEVVNKNGSLATKEELREILDLIEKSVS